MTCATSGSSAKGAKQSTLAARDQTGCKESSAHSLRDSSARAATVMARSDSRT